MEFERFRKGRGKWIASFDGIPDTGSRRYTISVDEYGKCGCSCAAWKFKKGEKEDCKHIDEFKRNVEAVIDLHSYLNGYEKFSEYRFEKWDFIEDALRMKVGIRRPVRLKSSEKDSSTDFLSKLKDNARWSF